MANQYNFVKEGRALGHLYPEITKEWNYDLNIDTPFDVSYGSKQKRWFTCKADHNYLAIINNKSRGSGCYECYIKIVGKQPSVVKNNKSLATESPHLAKEWHIDNTKKANEVKNKSAYLAKWICEFGHIWNAKVCNRTANKTGCPSCSNNYYGRQISKPEIILANALNGKLNTKIGNFKADILVKKTIIEYDGAYWHKDQYKHDLKKTNYYKSLGYKNIRIRVQDPKYKLKDIPNAKNIHFDIKDERILNINKLVKQIKKELV